MKYLDRSLVIIGILIALASLYWDVRQSKQINASNDQITNIQNQINSIRTIDINGNDIHDNGTGVNIGGSTSPAN